MTVPVPSRHQGSHFSLKQIHWTFTEKGLCTRSVQLVLHGLLTGEGRTRRRPSVSPEADFSRSVLWWV